MTIESRRLTFRKYNDDDFGFLWSLLSDQEMVRYIGKGQTKDEQDARDFWNWINSTYGRGPDMGLMVLENKQDLTLIGHAGLVPQTIDGVEELEVGYWISRDHWGNGYATEAAQTLREYGHRILGKERLISLIQPGNKASIRVAEKIGMDFDRGVDMDGIEVHIYSSYDQEGGRRK
ncbi:GNAT family N-acetyltransferase [Halobacillus salinus]|uniref:GNAT family N-acetyltransferase n=1 Tax=Halobacillus salinus TaxID=192814 RepID=UPI0009A859B8|nr:GNAT family N-acetyltransferase [Halobacillus salinus]